MSGQQGRPGWSTREVALIVVVIALAIVAGVFAFLYLGLKSDYASLQSQYNALTSQYNTLESKYSALQANYTNLQSQYNSLQSQYNNLETQYSSLQSQYSSLQSSYSTLQSQYSSLQSQYSNVSSLLNNFVTSMSPTGSDNIPGNTIYFYGLVYVPSGCTVSGVLTFSASSTVNVYIGDWISAEHYYAYNAGATSYGSWSWVYQWSDTSYINQPITLTTSNPYGDYYIIIIENDNPYSVSLTLTFTITHITCSS